MFLEDGVFVLYGLPLVTRAAIARMHAVGVQRRRPESAGHNVVDVVVEGDGDRAHVGSYLNEARTRYVDEWVRVEDGRWLLERRELQGTAPDPAVLDALTAG